MISTFLNTLTHIDPLDAYVLLVLILFAIPLFITYAQDGEL